MRFDGGDYEAKSNDRSLAGRYPPTYGFAAWYNPYTGTYGRGAAVYGPYGGAGGFAAYNPRTGTYARGGAVYGPYGSRGFGALQRDVLVLGAMK